jgi:heterodisulfide reductase subunit A
VVNGEGREVAAQPRIGVFVCHCGNNISDAVDVASVVAAARGLEGVVAVLDARFLCADTGQRLVREVIRRDRLTGVVMAGCSPQMHEQTFRQVVQSAGLNPFLLQIANIREQVSWVTPERGAATGKAAALVAAAVRRVSRHEPLQARQVPVTQTTLVVGAGVAGIETALRVADAGKRVILVEREPSIGGHLARLARTYPTLDCSACVLVPKMASAAEHPQILLFTNTRVEAVGGHVGNFRVRLRTLPRSINEADCTGCGLCVERCPWGDIPSEVDEGLGTRTAVHFPFPQAVPWVPVIDRATCAHFQSRTCGICRQVCPSGAVDFEQQDEVREVEAGAVVLATGFKLFDAGRASEYGYGRWPNVVTSLQFERMCHPSGPTGGRILLKSGRPPRSIAILHCVGSRDRRYNRHCSRVCCTTALKLALLARRQGVADVVDFFIDMRASGKQAEEFYELVQRSGVTFVQGRGAEVTCSGGTLQVRAEDAHLGRPVTVPAEMVVLAVGMEPHRDAAALAGLFGIACGEQGFFSERHLKFAPVQTAVEGVFIAGACQGPKDVPESVAQGGAAAAGVLALMVRGVVEIMPTVAAVDPGRCSGCGICLRECPYQALEIVASGERAVARVNDVLCKGCGSCVVSCPAGAVTQFGFTAGQLGAEVAGAVRGD